MNDGPNWKGQNKCCNILKNLILPKVSNENDIDFSKSGESGQLHK